MRAGAITLAVIFTSLGFSDSSPTHSNTEIFLKGIAFYDQKKYQQAIKIFTMLTTIEPTHSDYHRWLGRSYGRRAEAISKWQLLSSMKLVRKTRLSFELAVRLDASNHKALRDLFDFYLQTPFLLGRGLDNAKVIANKIKMLDESMGERAWAEIHEMRGQTIKARDRLNRAYELDRSGLDALITLASFESRHGALDRSDALYARAFQDHPESPQLWLSRAKSLLRSGRKETEALLLLKRCVDAKSNSDSSVLQQAQKLLNQ